MKRKLILYTLVAAIGGFSMVLIQRLSMVHFPFLKTAVNE